jgi:predicted nucleic acid-binding protein
MRKIIVNATPLIVLCHIGCLELLKKLYGKIIVPRAVYQEVCAKPDSVCQQIKDHADWIQVCDISHPAERKMYQAKLHAGEVEVMILASEMEAELLIIDDNAAKKTAKYLGFTVTGTLGVLLKAKQNGIVQEVRPLLQAIRKSGFYVSRNVENMVLSAAHEDI